MGGAPGEVVPRYTDRPLPPQRYLPGRTPRPRADATPFRVGRLDSARWWSTEPFRYGVDLWNHGFFWEAHEAWEEPWRAAGRATLTGRLLQGYILLAAAAVKHELGAGRAARRLAARGARRLADARAAPSPLDAPAFAAAVEAWVRGSDPTHPVLRLEEPPLGDPP